MAIDHELPILEYLVIVTDREDHEATLVFPETIQARHLVLVGIAPSIGTRLLTTAVGLVTLCLFMDDSSTYLNPKFLLQWISPVSTTDARDHHFSQPRCGDAAVAHANHHTPHFPTFAS
jgi:hypothetical protein